MSEARTIGLLQSENARLRAENEKLAIQVEQLKECLEPGKASAIVNGLFREAKRLGFYKPTAIHALTQFVERVEYLQSANEKLMAVARKAQQMRIALLSSHHSRAEYITARIELFESLTAAESSGIDLSGGTSERTDE